MAFTVTQVFLPDPSEEQTDGRGWWELKERLVGAGWSVKSSSDATTFGSGDNLEPGGPYTGTFDNTDAWMVLQAPAVDSVTREIMIQNTSTVGRVRFWYSSDGTGFSGGGATTRPTATDEEFLQDSGDNIFSTTNPQNVVVNYMIGDATEGYSFLMEVHAINESGLQGGCFMDVLSVAQPGDADPAVLSCFTDGTNLYYQTNSEVFTRTTVNASTTNIAGWFRKGEADEEWAAYPLGHPGYYDGSIGTLQMWHIEQNLDPNGAMILLPIIYLRGEDVHNSALGFKGVSRLFQIIPSRDTVGVTPLQLVSTDESLAAWHGVVRPWASGLDRRF